MFPNTWVCKPPLAFVKSLLKCNYNNILESYHLCEREAGKFSRVIGLPGDIDTDKVDAKLVNGLLSVTIAKAEASKPKQITIN